MKLLVVIEADETNYSAYVPDLPGCVSTGASREELLCNIREAIALHLAGMRQDGQPWPDLIETSAEMIEIGPTDIERAEAAFLTT